MSNAIKPIARTRRPQAERAAEHWLRHVCGCVVTRRAVRTQWQKVDFWGADVVGKTAVGEHRYAQATAGQASAVTARRRKLEKIPWHSTDRIFVLQLIQTPDPANRRRQLWHFRVHEFREQQWLTWSEATLVPRSWFRAWKEPAKLLA